MDFEVTLSVCPRCVSWQSGTNCGDCGSATTTPDVCSKCKTTNNTKYCTLCGAPTYITLLDPESSAQRPKNTGSYAVGSHSQIIYESSHTAQQLAPPHIKQPQRSGYSTTDTTSIFGSGITPSSVVKGRSGADDDPLAKYRVKSEEKDDSENWHQAIRSASRANVDESTGIDSLLRLDAQQAINAPPGYRATPKSPTGARPPSEALRNVNTRPGVKANPSPHNIHTNVNVIPDPTIKPSALKDQGDYLEKYRVKSVDPTLTPGEPVTSNVRPSVLKDQGDDYLERYRVKTPEEEERTWEISLRNLPVSSSKIVELQVDNRQLYSGSGNDRVVSSNFSTMCNSTSSQFVLKIGAINFNLSRSLEIGKGRFVRFSVEQGQMKFRQQKTPIED